MSVKVILLIIMMSTAIICQHGRESKKHEKHQNRQD